MEWHKIFSFQFFRFVGVLLVITAMFSLLFNIDWQLIQKLLASSISGLLLLGTAEWLRTKKDSVSPFCAILGFALLQFALSLMYQYAVQENWAALYLSGDVWSYLKLALTLVLAFTMTRYRAGWYPLLFVLVAYFTPVSLQYVGTSMSPLASAIFILSLTALTLLTGYMIGRRELFVTNALLANGFILWLLFPHAFEARALVLLVAIGVFAGQLLVSVFSSSKDPSTAAPHIANTIVAHIGIMLATLMFRPIFPLIDTYIGVAFLVLANGTLCAYLLARHLKANDSLTDVLLNTAVIMASIGLFIQVDGPWSAVVFLAYATCVLWFSLYRRNIRTRVYGSILLIVSLVKLYFEFSDIFDQVWGSLAILLIGLLLVALSYKFEAVKDVMLHGMKPASTM